MGQKKKITESMVVPANGRPEEVKVGYRTIKIKYVRPDFIMDDTVSYTHLTLPTNREV